MASDMTSPPSSQSQHPHLNTSTIVEIPSSSLSHVSPTLLSNLSNLSDITANINTKVTTISSIQKSTSPSCSSPRIRYCCCFPVSSGIWVISLLLIIPSVALILCFNVVNVRNLVRFNSPAHVKNFYTIVYSFYTVVGVVIAICLRRMRIQKQLKALIILYWLLFLTTIIEGIYFGIMMSKQKAKLVSYCENRFDNSNNNNNNNDSNSISNPSGGEASLGPNPKPSSPLICQGAGTIISIFYILGPGGWILLHSAWILIVVLYSKALRRQHPVVDEEEASTFRMLPNHRENAATEKYYQYSSKKSGSFPWRHLRPDINEKLATQRRQDKEEENSDDDEAEAQETAATRSRERGKERAEEGLGDQDPSSFSRPAMPRQQKSWWMEQIEANRAKR